MSFSQKKLKLVILKYPFLKLLINISNNTQSKND